MAGAPSGACEMLFMPTSVIGSGGALRSYGKCGARVQTIARLSAVTIACVVAGLFAQVRQVLTADAIFPELATEHDALLYPFFLDGVAADRALNQPDGLHPTARGIDAIVQRILPKAEELVARVKAKRGP